MVAVKMCIFALLVSSVYASRHQAQTYLYQDQTQKPAAAGEPGEVEWPWMHEGTPSQVMAITAESSEKKFLKNPPSARESSQVPVLVAPPSDHAVKLQVTNDVTLDPRPPSLQEEVDDAIEAQLHNRLAQKMMTQGACAQGIPQVPWWVLMCVCIGFVLLFLALLFYYGAMMLGASIKSAIETFDRKFIGVDIEIGDLSVALCSGRIDMHGLQVKNPEGYKSPYLLNASSVVIDLNVRALVFSFGKRIEVDVLELQDIDCIVEYDRALGGTSNVDRVMEHLNHDDKPSEKKAKKVQEMVNETGKAPPKKAVGNEILLHKVLFSKIGARVATSLGGVRVALGDITFDDFSKENGPHLLEDLVFIIFKSFSKTLMVNITGKSFVDKFM
jgi:hypothetical protein